MIRDINLVMIGEKPLAKILKDHKTWWHSRTKPSRGQMATLLSEDLSNLDLRGHELKGIDLSGSNLSQSLLTGCDLSWTTLTRANLRGADLEDVNFSHSDMNYADLTEANLRHAIFWQTELLGAIFKDADLRHADLRWANLKKADLRGANIDFSAWPLWCGSQDVLVDQRIAAQLAAHFCALECEDPEVTRAQKKLLAFAKKSHRAAWLEIRERDGS